MKRRLARGMTAFLCIAAALPATVARAGYQFTTIDPPGADGGSLGLGINNVGQVVGTSLDAGFNATGFVYSAGSFTFLSVPGAGGYSDANAINNNGDIAGDYNDADGFAHGFLRQGGVFSTLDSTPYGLNDGGMVVGTAFGGTGHPYGYVLFGGVSTPIVVPGALDTYAYGINNRGDVVGVLRRPGHVQRLPAQRGASWPRSEHRALPSRRLTGSTTRGRSSDFRSSAISQRRASC